MLDESGTGQQVVCTFPDDWAPVVRDLLGHRVIVEGFVRYRADGTPKSLSEPISIQSVPEPKRSLLELRGALPGISGGLSSFDYVKQLRAGQSGG